MCVSHVQKVYQLNVKIKIYQTIESLIILIIKFQFFNQMY